MRAQGLPRWRGHGQPGLDSDAMSTGLDRVDVKDLVSGNLTAMMQSGWWARDVQAAEQPPVVAIWPIKNSTSEHIEDQLLTLLSEIETTLVNSGAVNVVSRERQAELVEEVGVQNMDAFDPGDRREDRQADRGQVLRDREDHLCG